ncbi:hypothetical protein EF908_39700, partial [Streptomyces sp. WAC04770]
MRTSRGTGVRGWLERPGPPERVERERVERMERTGSGLERGERQQVGQGGAGLQGVDLRLVHGDEREVTGGVT